MERESQSFKIPEEKPEEISAEKSSFVETSEDKPEEIAVSEAEKELVPSEIEEKAKAELAKERQEQKEKEEFLGKMQIQEQEMAGGILRKFAEAPKSVKKGLMILAVAGVLLSAGKAFAGGEQWQRTHQGWQNTIRYGERQPVDYSRQQADRQRFEAYRDYQKQEQAIKEGYEQRKFDIMIGRLPGATDYFSKERAYQELEQWKNAATHQARTEWSYKVWAAEEAHRMQSGQIRR
ncbi:MAG: hypothetical protein Q8L57_03300 [bacterium]|nr:hypothetical protein [bacterium]